MVRNFINKFDWVKLIITISACWLVTIYIVLNSVFQFPIDKLLDFSNGTPSTAYPSITIPDQVFSFGNIYSWQTVLPDFIQIPFLNYSRFCIYSDYRFYFNNQPIPVNRLDRNSIKDGAAVQAQIALNDSSFLKLRVPIGQLKCATVETRKLIGSSWSPVFWNLAANVGGRAVPAQINTENTRIFLWPGFANSLICFFVLFLVITAIIFYFIALVNFFRK